MGYAKRVLRGLWEPGMVQAVVAEPKRPADSVDVKVEPPAEPSQPEQSNYKFANPPRTFIQLGQQVRLHCDATLRDDGEAYGGWVYHSNIGQFEGNKYLGNYPKQSTLAEVLAMEAAILDVVVNIPRDYRIHVTTDYMDLPNIIRGSCGQRERPPIKFRDDASQEVVERICTLLKGFASFDIVWANRKLNRNAHRAAAKAAPKSITEERVVYETPAGEKVIKPLISWNKLIKMSFEDMGKLKPPPTDS
jgi:hypothetical protein